MVIIKKAVKYLVMVFLIGGLTTISSVADQCYECHLSWEEDSDAPSIRFEYDVHFDAGLGCSDCHGGNPTLDDMDDVYNSRGYKGIPSKKDIPEFCASCHSDPAYMVRFNPAMPTDQLEKYKTSVHGKKLYDQGDDKVANCVSCHSVHNIQSQMIPTSTVNAFNLPGTCAKCHSDKEYMKDYNLSTSQFDEYSKSVHGVALLEHKDVGAPACNDCHGNHGATPPGVESISAVCGLCHALIAENFSVSPHKTAFDAAGYPECEICHDKHLIVRPQLHWVGDSDSALCVECHDPDDGTAGLNTASEVNKTLMELKSKYETAVANIDSADAKGMMVTDERFVLQEIEQAVIKARTAMHTFNSDSVRAVADEGIGKAEKVSQAGLAKIDDYYFRRKGLGVASLIITLLVIALFLKMRSAEKNVKPID
jgi:predicted CXXCH cytochrome family protein